MFGNGQYVIPAKPVLLALSKRSASKGLPCDLSGVLSSVALAKEEALAKSEAPPFRAKLGTKSNQVEGTRRVAASNAVWGGPSRGCLAPEFIRGSFPLDGWQPQACPEQT